MSQRRLRPQWNVDGVGSKVKGRGGTKQRRQHDGYTERGYRRRGIHGRSQCVAGPWAMVAFGDDCQNHEVWHHRRAHLSAHVKCGMPHLKDAPAALLRASHPSFWRQLVPMAAARVRRSMGEQSRKRTGKCKGLVDGREPAEMLTKHAGHARCAGCCKRKRPGSGVFAGMRVKKQSAGNGKLVRKQTKHQQTMQTCKQDAKTHQT